MLSDLPQSFDHCSLDMNMRLDMDMDMEMDMWLLKPQLDH